jgi:hypothetical protein
MKLSFKVGCVLALVSLGGCLSDPDDSPATPTTPVSTRHPDLARWASTATPSLPGDSNLATAPLRDRWDSVANLSRYRAEARRNLSAIAADWATRDPVALGWQAIDSAKEAKGTTYLVRYAVEGIAQGGLLWVPNSKQRLGVVLFAHPGDQGVDGAFLQGLRFLMGALDTQAVILAPAFRGEPASLNGTVVESDSTTRSPWDRDVDDALAFLSAGLERLPQADPARLAALGYSRGGGVALLGALRDDRIRSVFEIAGPTDFFSPSLQRIALGLVTGTAPSLPGLDDLNTRFFQPFLSGRISADSLRREFLARSPARWALSGLLPPAGAAHGKLDTIVPPDQLEALVAALPPLVYTRFETMTHTSFLSEPLQGFSMALALQNFLKAQWTGR